MMKDLMKKLLDVSGISGFEENVAEIIEDLLKECSDIIEIDALGNIIAFKKGKKMHLK